MDENDLGFFEGAKKTMEEFSNDLLSFKGKFTLALQNMVGESNRLNTTFLQTRSRITEINVAIADSVPEVRRLGGGIQDVGNTLNEVATATRRNVIASTEDVAKLYAASKLVGENVSTIVGSFQDVGVQFSQVGKQLESSIGYIQSVGGNAGQIMSTVMGYMDQMNRYNFADGVVGLTKMATQASLLRFDMNQTLNLSEKALSPEGAIDLASAFQRLGVAAGDLADPFQLMNKSLNDPQGLQNSIIDVAKQFSYFDEKTKTFKINPQGVLMLKEIQDQTGLSAKEMSKLAVNAADLDKKLSSLKPSIKFENEEDKMYLANIAKMSEAGTYQVTLDDQTTVDLNQLNQQQINKLIEDQKKPQKTLEDLQRDQLGFSTLIASDVEAIKDKLVFGVTSADMFRKNLEGARRVLTTSSGVGSKIGTTGDVRGLVDDALEGVKNVVTAFQRGDGMGEEQMKKTLSGLMQRIEGMSDQMSKTQLDALNKIIAETKGTTGVESFFKDYLLEPMKKSAKADIDKDKKTADTKPDKLDGATTTTQRNIQQTQSYTQNINFGGQSVIVHKFDAPPTGIDQEYITKYFQKEMTAEKIANMVLDKMGQMNITQDQINQYKPKYQ